MREEVRVLESWPRKLDGKKSDSGASWLGLKRFSDAEPKIDPGNVELIPWKKFERNCSAS